MNPEPTRPAPPFDPDLQPVLDSGMVPSTMTVEAMTSRRAATPPEAVAEILEEWGMICEDRTVPGVDGDPDVTVSVFRPRERGEGGPGFYFAHSGGMVVGDRFTGIGKVLEWVRRYGGVAVSVEYRLAPEHPDPAPFHDCLAGLRWTVGHAGELGYDPARLVAVGMSAGGGLLAGAMLRAHDEGMAMPAAQVLVYPMLDDRNETVSSRQIDGIGVWDRSSNEAGWTALLGDRRGTTEVSPYSAPGRATDLSGLPDTYVDCGSAEVFRDEAVAFASRIWADGGSAELHVLAGAFHGFDLIAPAAAVSVAAHDSRIAFLDRVLGSPAPTPSE